MSENLDQDMHPETPKSNLSTRSVGIRYGIFMGIAGIAYFVIANVAGLDMNQGPWRWASFIYIIAILVLAQKYFKDSGNGYMSYGEGMGIAFWCGLISSVVSSIFSYIYWKVIDSGMITMAMDNARKKMEEDGKLSEEQIEQAMAITSKFMTPEWFLFFGLFFGVIMIVIVGLIISAIMTKKNPNPVYN